MLGLGSSITSGVPESKYSISLGGTDDYVDLGNVHNLGTGDFSFSFWVKASDTTTNFLFTKYEDGSNYYYIRFQGSDKIQFRTKVGGVEIMNLVCTTAVNAGEFNHIVITCDRSNSTTGLKYYLNGNYINQGAASATDIDNTGDFNIGKYGSTYAEAGTILDEVAVFNVALVSGAVTDIYNLGSPINLTFDQGNHLSATVQGYYKMGDGSFDDKANGVIHDQDNPGFGAEKITNGDFTAAGTLGDTTYSLGWGRNGAGSDVSISGGELILFNSSGSANDGRIYATNSVSENFNVITSGKFYRLTYTISQVSGGTPDLQYHTGGSYVDFTASQQTVGTHTKFYKATGSIFLLRQQAAGVTVKVSNVSLVELNGKPGLTSGGPTFSSDTP